MFRREHQWISFLCGLLMCLVPSATMFAAEAVPRTLTLDQAIQLALTANLTLKQSANQVEMASINVQRAQKNFLPDLNVTGRGSHSFAQSLNLQSGQYEYQGNSSFALNADSTLNLFNGFLDTATLHQSQLEQKSIQNNLERTKQTITFQTYSRFFAVVIAQELIAVEQENLKAQHQLLGQVEDFYKTGKRPITDVYQQQAEISQAEYRLLNAQRNLEVSKLQLLDFLGQTPTANYTVVAPEIPAKSHAEPIGEDSIAQALRKRPDVLAQDLQIQAFSQEIRAARSGYYPKLYLFAGLGSNYASKSPIGTFSQQFFDRNFSGSIGLTLSVPVLDKSRTRSNVALAQLNLQNQYLEKEKLQQQVSLEVQQALADWDIAKKQLEVAESQVKFANAALESLQERYHVNAATMTELTQMRARFLQALYDSVSARYNLVLRRVALAYFTGAEQTNRDVLN